MWGKNEGINAHEKGILTYQGWECKLGRGEIDKKIINTLIFMSTEKCIELLNHYNVHTKLI